MLALVDRYLLAPVEIKINGRAERVTAIEAIMLKLFQKMLDGNARAGRVLLKYLDLVARDDGNTLELEFIDGDNARALAEGVVAKDPKENGNE